MNNPVDAINRLQFLKQLGLSGSALLAFYCAGTLSSCSKAEDTVTPLGTDGVTLDLTSSAFSGLKTVGNYAYSGNVLVAHIKNGSYIAVSKICTHEGSTVRYVASADNLYCAEHGAQYTTSGTVTQGPATRSLTQYKTTLSSDGNSLLITNA